MNDNNDIETKIKNLIAEHIGTEASEIKNEDSFESDLHMNASDFTDFLKTLDSVGLTTENIDATEIETVDDLIEVLAE